MLVCIAPLWAASNQGKLFILGGNMGLSNEEVWLGILEAANGGKIGVIPAASGSPVSASNLIVDTFEFYESDSAVAFNVSADNPLAAEDPTIANAIRSMGGIYLTGGDQSRAVEVLTRSDGSPTLALQAILDVLDGGGVVAGSSAGAALMSDPMITGGSSSDALENGIGSQGVSVGPGLGFFEEGITDQHFLRRGRLGRLIVATLNGPYRFGFGVDEDSALIVDRTSRTGTAIGAMGVVIVDVRDALLHSDGSLDGIRIHYIETGDQFDFATGIVTPVGKTLIDLPSFPSTEISSGDVWGDYEVWRLMFELVDRRDTSVALGNDTLYDVYFRKTALSEGYRGSIHSYGNNRRAYTIINLLVTIVEDGNPIPEQAGSSWLVY